MLGRTNITTVKGGTIVSDVEDFAWNEVGTLRVDGAFKRTFLGNNVLVAVTEGGTVIYSRDGENWEEAVYGTDAEYKIVDGVWDGKRFVFAANDPAIITTEDFQEYKSYEIPGAQRLFAIFYNTDGTYTVIGAYPKSSNSTAVALYKGMPEGMECAAEIEHMINSDMEDRDRNIKFLYVKAANTSNALICYVKGTYSRGTELGYAHQLGVSGDGTSVARLLPYYGTANVYTGAVNQYRIFSFKNALYYTNTLEENKKLIRLKDLSDENGDVVSTGKDWGFIGGAYFNKCDIFVNANQMLVVKPGEYLAEKTIEELIDITYDFSITNIIKAFGKLYLFGTNGHILVSSDEIKNENAISVKTMSANKALYEAKEYTDKKYKELEERVARLEEVNNISSTEV